MKRSLSLEFHRDFRAMLGLLDLLGLLVLLETALI
jgi:hypothetical protein